VDFAAIWQSLLSGSKCKLNRVNIASLILRRTGGLMANGETQANGTSKFDKVKFHYIKSNFFRVIHVDGVMGALTPTLDLFVTLYNQRGPIPTVTVQTVMKDGRLGDEIMAERESKEGIVREAEVGAIMNLDTAKSLYKWLEEKIQLAEAQKEAIERKNKEQEHD
jgi:hypothetical protein